jgi:hypothetical protein
MNKLYQMKLKMEATPMIARKKSENTLKDLLQVLPLLRKNKMHGEVQTEVKKLRGERTARSHTLELSRKVIRPPAPETVKIGNAAFKIRGMDVPVVTERKAIHKDIMVSSVLPSAFGKKKNKDGTPMTKVQVLEELKKQIVDDIKKYRSEQKTVFETVTMDEGIQVKKLSQVYIEGGAFFKIYNKKLRTGMTKGKKPTFDDKYIGIEIEFACKQSIEQVCNVLFEHGLAKYVHVHRDGSIKIDNDHPHQIEIGVLCRQVEVEEIVSRLCDALNRKLNVMINASCGLHVHLDMRKRDYKKSYANLINMQNILYAMVPANRATNEYSVPMKHKTFDDSLGTARERNAHYDGISAGAYNKHKTIEVRMHCGSSQASKIINWVKLLASVVDADGITQSYQTIKDAQSILKVSDDLCNYVNSRIAKFADQHKKITKAPQISFMERVAPVAEMPDTLPTEQSEVA